MLKLKFLYPADEDVIFDDYTEKHGIDNPDEYFGWSQICDKCLEKLEYRPIDEWVGHGICGVEGCNRKSDHYIDFECSDVELIEEE